MSELEVLKQQPAVQLIQYYFKRGGEVDLSNLHIEFGVSSESLYWAAKELFIAEEECSAQSYFRDKGNHRWELKPEVLFGYLSFLEYQAAREDAKRAGRIALASIIIAVLIGVGSIIGAILG